MATILRNDDAEALILDIRTGRRAAGQVIDESGGAFLVFPTSVVTACPGGGQSVFPLTIDAEPGTVVGRAGTATVSGRVDGVAVSGRFHWTAVDEGPASVGDAAGYRFEHRGHQVAAPEWADQLPRSCCLVTETPKMLARQQTRLVRRGRAAEHWLLTLTERIVRQACRGPIRLAIHLRPQVDVDDVVQRAMQTAGRLVAVYASPDRPPCSWLGMIKLDGRRDMHREVCRLDWRLPGSGPGRQKFEAASLLAIESMHQSLLEAGVARLEPEYQAVDDEPGRAAAAVARLVGGDPDIVALAAGGDSRALRCVSQQVIGALARAGESQAGTRQRCWTEFQRTGRLFSTDAGRCRFGSLSDDGTLAAIDASLGEAAGVCGPAGGTW